MAAPRWLKRIDPLLLGIVAVAFALRVQGINDDGYWLDEVTSLNDAARPVALILAGKGRPGHPPLFYLLLKAWTALFGTSETAVRLLSALFGAATVAMTGLLMRRLHGRAAGLLAALLLALSFHHIVFSQEARNYALLGLLAVATVLALWRAVAEGGKRRWAVYVCCALLMAYTHHQAYVVLLGAAAGAGLAATVGRGRRGALRGLLLADAVVIVGATPSILVYLVGGLGEGRMSYGFWQPRLSWQSFVEVAAMWTPGAPLVARDAFLYSPHAPRVPWMPWLLPAIALPAAFLALAWTRARTERGEWDPPSPRPPPTLFHAGLLYVGLGLFAAIALAKPIWHIRYVFVLVPFFLGGLAALVGALRSRPARVAALAVGVALSLPSVVTEKGRPSRTPWRETAAYVAAKQGRDVCLIGPMYLSRPFGWYYKRPFTVVPDADALVTHVRRAVGRGPVLVVYCNAHGPPDPRHLGARQLARTLEVRSASHFGPLHVYEFAKPLR